MPYPRITQLFNRDNHTSQINEESNSRKLKDIEYDNIENGSGSLTPNQKGERFENRVWHAFNFFKLSIKYVSLNRSGSDCKYEWGEGAGRSSQLDGLFISDNVAFFIECKAVNSNLDVQIESFINKNKKVNRNGFTRHIKQTYSVDTVLPIFASKKELNENQINLLVDEGIIPFDINKLLYLEGILDAYKANYEKLAFTNLLRHVLNLKIPTGQDIWVRATKYYSPLTGGACFAFSTNPSKIMDLTTVNHRTNDAGINLTYQRFVQYDKLNKVKTYLKDYDKQFPNNIILASRTITEAKNFKAIDVSQKFLKANSINSGNLDSSKHGLLNLSGYYGDLEIIDGQHRLFGYNQIPDRENKHFLNVLLYDKKLSSNHKMQIFVDINDNQKPLDPSIKWELYEETLKDSSVESDILKSRVSKFFNKYLKEEDFVLYHRVKPGVKIELTQKNVRQTLAAICDITTKYKASNQSSSLFKFLFEHDRWSSSGNRDRMEKISRLFHDYFIAISQINPEDFDKNSKGLTLFGSSFSAYFIILFEILNHWDINGQLISNLSTRSGRIEKFKELLSGFFENEIHSRTTPEQRKRFKEMYYGQGGPIKIACKISEYVRKINGYSEFAPNLYNEGAFEIEAILDILNHNGETLDLEAKESIYKVTSNEHLREKTAEEQLESVNMLHNTIGGRIVCGIKEINSDRYEVVGIDDEYIQLSESIVEYKRILKNKIKSMSQNKINVKIDHYIYDEKTILVIRVPKIKEGQTRGNRGHLGITIDSSGQRIQGIPEFVEHKYDKVKDPNTNQPLAPAKFVRTEDSSGTNDIGKEKVVESNIQRLVEGIINERDNIEDSLINLSEYLSLLRIRGQKAYELENEGHRIDHGY